MSVVERGSLHFGGEVEQIEEFVVREVEVVEEVGAAVFRIWFGANMVATEDASIECLFT
jgi:hypothetical protein